MAVQHIESNIQRTVVVTSGDEITTEIRSPLTKHPRPRSQHFDSQRRVF
jgi:hypothetical protein